MARKSKYLNHFIYKLIDGNPRRKGTKGNKSFSIINNGMKYETYLEKGGRYQDLKFDLDKKYILISDKFHGFHLPEELKCSKESPQSTK